MKAKEIRTNLKLGVLSFLSASLLLGVLSGCVAPITDTRSNEEAGQKRMGDLRNEAAEENINHPAFEVEHGVYIGNGAQLPIPFLDTLPPVFKKTVTLSGPPELMQQVVDNIVQLSGMPVHVAPDVSTTGLGGSSQGGGASGGGAAGGAAGGAGTGIVGGAAAQSGAWAPDYTGTLAGLMDVVVAHYGAYWRVRDGGIEIYKTDTRVYTLATSPGQWTANGSVSNTSTGGGGTAGVSGTSTGTQAVTVTENLAVWTQVAADVNSMTSKDGKVSSDPSTGTFVVTDIPPALDRIAAYIDQANRSLLREVSITVRLYTLSLTQQQALGFNLAATFENLGKDVQLTTTPNSPISLVPGVGDASAVVLAGGQNTTLGQWANTNAMVEALQSVGKVYSVTQGGAIIRNNLPAPVQQTNSQTYIAQVSAVAAGVGTTSQSLTPGTVVSGFSMLATPHILDDGRIVLNYSVNVAVLNSITNLSSGGQTIGGPNVTNRNYVSEVTLHPGDTLVTVPFQIEQDEADSSSGLGSLVHQDQHTRVEVIMTISASLMPTT